MAPNTYPMAENFAALSRSACCQGASSSSEGKKCQPASGSFPQRRGMLFRRTLASAAPSAQGAPPSVHISGCSMLDWPPASQTSPQATSVKDTTSAPQVTVMQVISPGPRVSIQVIHRPSVSARQEASFAPRRTVTALPAGACPHTGFSRECRSTMWSEKMSATVSLMPAPS